VHRRVSGEIDYGRYDQPTAQRGRDRVEEEAAPGVAPAPARRGGEAPETLNVPAFLRRQAD
ncbi:MAG: cell division protein FtsZ, partial [Pseudomonadota bacterium]